MSEQESFLIVDGDAARAAAMAACIEQEDCRALVAPTVARSGELAAETAPIGVLLDLPASLLTDGPLLGRLREARPEMVILIAVDEPSEAVRMLDEGASDIMQRPIDPALLCAKVRAAREGARLLRENRRLHRENGRGQSEREQLAEALAESRARFRAVFDSAIDGIALIDPRSDRISSANDAFCELTARSRAEVLQRPASEILPLDELLHEEHANHSGAPDARKPVPVVRLTPLTGHPRYIEARLTSIVLAGKTYRMGVFHDITGVLQVQEALQRAEKSEAIGALASGIAHDFNNVLYAITGYTRLVIEDVPANSRASNNLEQVMGAANRATELVKRVLAVSQPGPGRPERLELPALVEETLRLLHRTLPSNVEVRRLIDRRCGPILADPALVQRTVLALCSRAARAMILDGGVLTVYLEEVPADEQVAARRPELRNVPCACLRISDNGVGLDAAALEQALAPGFCGGIGGAANLGLAAALGNIERLGGTLDVVSDPGEGTAVTIHLPITGVVERSSADAAVARHSPQGRARILFVDDEEMLTGLADAALQRQGFEVRAVTNSAKALNLFRSDPDAFDAVITDQMMPQMTGAALAREILQMRPDIPIILCTGYSDVIDEAQAKAIGIRQFCLKPIDMEQLGEQLIGLLEDAEPIER